ncbi:MAG: 4-hydroxythreonine-4-phosphate dehydrogenase PdxA, partial [Dongiaceae bacterium]
EADARAARLTLTASTGRRARHPRSSATADRRPKRGAIPAHAAPRIGVCGINPHAGENGLFGHGEEASKIAPAIAACQAKGWNVKGPLPADTLFFLAARGDYDIVVAMYHDQGHGPIKVMGLEAGVNITVGLPVIRTSVDHGTAFDIAGKGVADERSLIEALRQAVDLAPKQLAA